MGINLEPILYNTFFDYTYESMHRHNSVLRKLLFKGGFFWIFDVRYSTLLHLPPLRFHCVGGGCHRTQDYCDFGFDSQTLLPLG